jgi:hypothetical protein
MLPVDAYFPHTYFSPNNKRKGGEIGYYWQWSHVAGRAMAAILDPLYSMPPKGYTEIAPPIFTQ